MSGQPNDDLKALIYEFVKAFARFEYALQQTGSRTGREGDTPRTCWEGARKRLAAYRWSDEAEALLAKKPTSQIIRANRTEFEPVNLAGKSDLDRAIALVKAIRNNLFHGGKSDKSGWDDPDRMRDLLPAATTVIHQMADADRDVSSYFRGEF